MRNLLVAFLILCSYSMALAWGNGPSVQVSLLSYSTTSEYEPKPDDDKKNHHRTPSRPIPCSISVEDGVSFDDGSNPDIISYEIKDADNNPIAVTGDEADFIQTLFTLMGEYQILFRTDDYVYYGGICI